jgi:hypothetical protein
MPVYDKVFTQIVEDVMLEMRESSTDTTVKKKYKRRVNDIYVREIPSKFEWDWLRSLGTLSLQAAYKTGTVTVVNGSASITGSGTTWTSAMSEMKFSVPSTNEVYTFTRTGNTTGTISPVYQGASGSDLGYVIFQDTYALASDYSRATNVPGFYYDYSTGRPTLDWYDDTKWYKYYTTQTSQFPKAWRECPTRSSMGLYQVQIQPPVDTARIVSYEYIKALPEMSDFSTGTASTTAASKTVTTLADYSASISAGQYFRVNSDGTWCKISTVSGTTITLTDNYPTTNTTVAYTVSDAPSSMPYQFQVALFHGACWLTAMEQGDKATIAGYSQVYLRSLDLDMARRNRKRYGRQYMKRAGIRYA